MFSMQVLIVLWYKDGYGKPIYSFDLRNESPASEGVLWALEDGGSSPRAQLNIRYSSNLKFIDRSMLKTVNWGSKNPGVHKILSIILTKVLCL